VPELPEVETVVRDLRPLLVGHRLTAVKQTSRRALRQPWRSVWNTEVAGQRVSHVERRGKWILIGLEEEKTLVVHLGMTGQLTVESANEPIASHVHLVFPLDDGTNELRFRDIRRFGSARLFHTAQELDDFFVASGLGPEPFDLSASHWRDCLRSCKRCLKAVLLDQTVVAGVGNIYADESLFQARLHPAQAAQTLGKAEADRLRRAVASVLHRAIQRRGSSIRNYVGGSGLQGEFQNEHHVYGRTGEPCPRCGTAIARVRLAGRSSHFCPKCQPAVSVQRLARSAKR
jgi:formamidopyrimidine-DNA glycosylase